MYLVSLTPGGGAAAAAAAAVRQLDRPPGERVIEKVLVGEVVAAHARMMAGPGGGQA